VSKAASSTAVTFSQNPAGSFLPVNIQATIPVMIGTIPPTGTVTFLDGSTQIGTANIGGTTVGPTGVFVTAVLSRPFAPGAHSIVAQYSGDSNYSPSASPAASLTVLQGLTPAVTMAVSQNPTFAGQPVTITATVNHPFGNPSPSGTVTFFNGSLSIGFAGLGSATPTSETATLRITPFPAGTYNITARYSGDTVYNAVTSAAVALTVR
jgi:hypothetical protein